MTMTSASPTERERLRAALEDLRVVDRMLAGIEGSPARFGELRTLQMMETASPWARSGFRFWQPAPPDDSPTTLTTEDFQQVNTELLSAQALLVQVRTRVGIVDPWPLVELPLQGTRDDDTPYLRSVDDDLADIQALRERVRELFAELHQRDPELARSVAPLEHAEGNDEHQHQHQPSHADSWTEPPTDLDSPELDDDDDPTSVDPKPYLAFNMALTGLAAFGFVLGAMTLVALGQWLLLLLLAIGLSLMLYVFWTSLDVLRGTRTDARRVLERQAPIIMLAIATTVLGGLGRLITQQPIRGRHAPGILTMLVYYAARLHAATQRPAQPQIHPAGLVAVVVAVLIEIAVVYRILSGP